MPSDYLLCRDIPPLPENTKKRKPRKGRVLPPPKYSGRIYAELAKTDVNMFRCLLEAEDNIGLMSVVDRFRTVLMVRFSPHQEKEVLRHLEAMRESLNFRIISFFS